MTHQITDEAVSRYQRHLSGEEYAEGTIQKYLRDIRAFRAWLEECRADKGSKSVKKGESHGNTETNEKCTADRNDVTDRETAAGWKSHLVAAGYAPVTINAMLSSLNGLFEFLGWEECKVKFLKIQRRTFRDQDRELTRAEYRRLLESAGKQGNLRLALLLETICSTGIRVSEVKYVTVESLKRRKADVSLKGKIRTILLPGKLCKKLRDYAKKHKIKSGEIFITKSGKSMCRRQIWGEMKQLCEKAKVSASKVFPHNLRHLFARTFYQISRDIVKLADVLGHSSIETTRIYLISTGETHARQMERLGLIS
nr:tyrosine-type recombinase/integrase [uncultured Acetatifactor sp.]